MSDEQGKVNNCIHHDVDTLCLAILEVLIQTILTSIDKDVKVFVSINFMIFTKWFYEKYQNLYSRVA